MEAAGGPEENLVIVVTFLAGALLVIACTIIENSRKP